MKQTGKLDYLRMPPRGTLDSVKAFYSAASPGPSPTMVRLTRLSTKASTVASMPTAGGRQAASRALLENIEETLRRSKARRRNHQADFLFSGGRGSILPTLRQ